MKEKTQVIRSEIKQFQIKDSVSLEQYRLKFLSKKGIVPELFSVLGEVTPEERGPIGKLLNELKIEAQNKYDDAKIALESNFT